MCTPVGRKCPNNYLSPKHPKWSELEEENWYGEKQKKKECKEEESKDSEVKELKQKPKTHYPPSPQSTPSFHPGSDSEGFTPILTDMMVPAPEKELKEEQNKKEDRYSETDYDSDNNVSILRSELIQIIKVKSAREMKPCLCRRIVYSSFIYNL